jgi:hypothetical protein
MEEGPRAKNSREVGRGDGAVIMVPENLLAFVDEVK